MTAARIYPTLPRGPVLIKAWADMKCPACGLEERVSPPLAPCESRMHFCPKLHGLAAPLVPQSMDCKLVAMPWEDWQGRTMTQDGDDGRPYSSIETIRADGSNDCRVLAPCAEMIGGT